MTIDGTPLRVADLPDWDAPPSGRWRRGGLPPPPFATRRPRAGAS